ncbi:MAG: 3-dehydroquinate synthase family protein [Thermoanaerobaculia bacterium]
MTAIRRLTVRAGAGRSVIWIGRGVISEAARRLNSPSGRFLLIAPVGAAEAAGRVREALSGRVFGEFVLDDREESKTLATVERIADAALAAGIRRDDAVVAVGGGVTSDVSGFAAAILLRGVTWNAVPTTTAAMADAAVGGKTGVDHARGKNLLGAFHPPAVILVDTSALETLPEREHRSGLVEAFKAAWVADAKLAAEAERRLEGALAREARAVTSIVVGALRIKARLVASDPRDAADRRLLNFGHTLGHAFEAAGGYARLRHGEAVAWGIAGALQVSGARAGLPAREAERIRSVLARLGPFPEPDRSPETLRPFLRLDKKGTSAGSSGVLLEGIGRGRIEADIPEDEWLEAAARARIG